MRSSGAYGMPASRWPKYCSRIARPTSRNSSSAASEDVGHPVNARVAHSTVPVRFSAGPDRFHLQPAPLLGQHNRELLAEIGLSEPEIAELEAEGVIGRAPGDARMAAER